MCQDAREAVANAGAGSTPVGPERTCAVTRAILDPDQLIRFVRAPDGHVVPDLARRLPGRGVWISCSRAVVETARASGAFAKALRHPVNAPDELADLVDSLMTRRVMEALSLANKAGLVMTGFVKCETVIGSGRCAALMHAADAADDGAGKLDRRFRAVWDERNLGGEPPIVTDLASAELGLAIGRSNVVHAALTSGGAGRHFLSEAGRLRRYRAVTGAPARSPKARAKTEKA